MSIYDKPNINKGSTISYWIFRLMQPTDNSTRDNSNKIAIRNFQAIHPGKSIPRKIFSYCDGRVHEMETQSTDLLSIYYLDISSEYLEQFREAIKDEEDREKEVHTLRALFRKLLNEANTYQELLFMIPKSFEPVIKDYFQYSLNDIGTIQDYRYYAAIKKAVKFNRENKKSVDILKNRLFINMLIQK